MISNKTTKGYLCEVSICILLQRITNLKSSHLTSSYECNCDEMYNIYRYYKSSWDYLLKQSSKDDNSDRYR